MTELRRTPLYALQKARNARFVPFGGWELPVQYTGLIAEHTAVRERAGLFDVSHMGELVVRGRQAADAVQYAITNDLTKLGDGKALYTVMCLDNGGIVDDLIVYREATDRYFICVNASRIQADFEHLRRVARDFDCVVENRSDDYAQLALQGPQAHVVLDQLTGARIAEMPPFTWTDAEVAGIGGVRVARTGYTGEPGCELYCRSEDAAKLWVAIEEAGRKVDLALCGLGARDTLRLEMKYALYGNDIDEQHNPYEAGLGWVVKLGKGSFMGRTALAGVKERGPERIWVGFKMLGRGIPRHGYPIAHQGKSVGVVTSGTHSPTLGEPIGAGYVPAQLAVDGTELDIVIRDKPVAARVVPTPFYKPKKG